MRLASVRIFVDDVEAAAAFYENVAGLERLGTAPSVVLFGDSSSILVEAADDEARRGGLLGRSGVAFETDDAQSLYAALAARGVPLHDPPETQAGGGVLVFAQDPAGKSISFVQYPAKSSDRRGS